MYQIVYIDLKRIFYLFNLTKSFLRKFVIMGKNFMNLIIMIIVSDYYACEYLFIF